MRLPDTERCALMHASSDSRTTPSCSSRPWTRREGPTICSPSWRSQESTSRQKPSIEAPGNKPLRELQEELERASDGLVYSSESDRPFEFFAIPYSGKRTSPTAGEFARLIGAESDV